ncbi:MAG: hypothetical protein ACJAZ8_000828 [Planctomycetota bacterium]|jgi:hypothetical protein
MLATAGNLAIELLSKHPLKVLDDQWLVIHNENAPSRAFG